MLTLSHGIAVLIGAAMAIWLGVAVWAVWTGLKLRKRAAFSTNQADRLALLLESAPALPLMVRNDGRIEAPDRLADWLGLKKVPNFLSDLAGNQQGLTADDAAALVKDVSAAQKTGRNFTRALRAQGSSRTLLIRGAPASSRLGAHGGVILWVFDATESQAEIGRLGEETARLGKAFETLSGLIEAAPIPMWHRGGDMRMVLVNTAYVRAVEGESAEDVVARGVELIDGSSSESPLTSALKAKEQGLPVTRVVSATVAGERKSVRIVDVPLGEAGVAGYAIDVDELEKANAAFRRFADTQRDTLDRLSAGVVQFARDHSLVFCNQPFQSMFNLKAEWIAEHPDFDRMLDRMREANRLPETRDFPGWRRERRGWFTAAGGAIEENWLIHGGEHYRVVAQPLPDGGLLLVFEDRTEQAQLSSARDTLLRVRTATFDNLFEAIGVFESDGRLHIWNSKFRDVWGFDEEFFAQHPRVDALVEAIASRLANPSRASIVRDLVRSATQERTQRSGRVVLKDGRSFEFAAVPLPDGNALFTMLDITDSRKVERVLRDRAAALEEAGRIKSAFVSNMSYELRTPLTSISGFAQMLEQGLAGPLDPQARDYVTAILESTEKLGSLVDRVLDLTQSDAGELPLDKQPVDLVALARKLASEHKEAAAAKQIDFAVEVDPSAGIVQGDGKRLAQAMGHLLDNAITFTQAGGRVLLHASGDDAQALLAVSDNGPGLDAGQQARALDRFSRAHEPGEDDNALGIGLPLAKELIEAHGGVLTLLSEPGEGTAITIELPRA
jgi:signal transduction histidine kinase